jgi:hypothetical protein
VITFHPIRVIAIPDQIFATHVAGSVRKPDRDGNSNIDAMQPRSNRSHSRWRQVDRPARRAPASVAALTGGAAVCTASPLTGPLAVVRIVAMPQPWIEETLP